MSGTQQTEALRFAEMLDKYSLNPLREASAELRRQQARIEELEEQLSAIGAGGVEPLRKSAPAPAPNERAAFEAWLRIKPCGAAHDFAWEAWRARAALAATQPAAQGLDAETQRHAAIGKAIERACADLPEETEINVSLEKDAGTVTMIDQDGNEHENFSCDYGFAGVLNEAIDVAIAVQSAKQGGEA